MTKRAIYVCLCASKDEKALTLLFECSISSIEPFDILACHLMEALYHLDIPRMMIDVV